MYSYMRLVFSGPVMIIEYVLIKLVTFQYVSTANSPSWQYKADDMKP